MKKNKVINFVDGTLCHIDFRGNVGSEINSVHLGVLYNLPKIDNLALCIPLTSPKEKHFKTKEDYNNRISTGTIELLVDEIKTLKRA